jgi:hypothetical protein
MLHKLVFSNSKKEEAHVKKMYLAKINKKNFANKLLSVLLPAILVGEKATLSGGVHVGAQRPLAVRRVLVLQRTQLDLVQPENRIAKRRYFFHHIQCTQSCE